MPKSRSTTSRKKAATTTRTGSGFRSDSIPKGKLKKYIKTAGPR